MSKYVLAKALMPAAYKIATQMATGTPYSGGNTRTRTYTTKKRKSNPSKKSIKAVMMRNIDNHHMSTNDSTIVVTNAGFTHNTLYTHNITGQITQGTANSNRIGDKIHIQSYRVRGSFIAPTTAGAYTYRVIVCWSGNEFTAPNLTSGIGSAALFLPNTGGSNLTTGLIDPKAVTVLYDETYDINSQVSPVADISSVAFTVPINQDFVYENAGAVFGKFKNMYLIVLGFAAGGTPGTTLLGTALFSEDIIFKPL